MVTSTLLEESVPPIGDGWGRPSWRTAVLYCAQAYLCVLTDMLGFVAAVARVQPVLYNARSNTLYRAYREHAYGGEVEGS